MTERCVYFINELVRDTDGGYIPCIAVEGEQGYHKTDWNWGKDLALANQIADEKNAAMGITPRDAMIIVIGTMRSIK